MVVLQLVWFGGAAAALLYALSQRTSRPSTLKIPSAGHRLDLERAHLRAAELQARIQAAKLALDKINAELETLIAAGESAPEQARALLTQKARLRGSLAALYGSVIQNESLIGVAEKNMLSREQMVFQRMFAALMARVLPETAVDEALALREEIEDSLALLRDTQESLVMGPASKVDVGVEEELQSLIVAAAKARSPDEALQASGAGEPGAAPQQEACKAQLTYAAIIQDMLQLQLQINEVPFNAPPLTQQLQCAALAQQVQRVEGILTAACPIFMQAGMLLQLQHLQKLNARIVLALQDQQQQQLLGALPPTLEASRLAFSRFSRSLVLTLELRIEVSQLKRSEMHKSAQVAAKKGDKAAATHFLQLRQQQESVCTNLYGFLGQCESLCAAAEQAHLVNGQITHLKQAQAVMSRLVCEESLDDIAKLQEELRLSSARTDLLADPELQLLFAPTEPASTQAVLEGAP